MATKRYILTIEYDPDTEEMEYIQEEMIDNDPVEEYTELLLDEYFDKEVLEWISERYIIGIS
jgi:hypothetical protein